jgi:hypothetical protein
MLQARPFPFNCRRLIPCSLAHSDLPYCACLSASLGQFRSQANGWSHTPFLMSGTQSHVQSSRQIYPVSFPPPCINIGKRCEPLGLHNSERIFEESGQDLLQVLHMQVCFALHGTSSFTRPIKSAKHIHHRTNHRSELPQTPTIILRPMLSTHTLASVEPETTKRRKNSYTICKCGHAGSRIGSSSSGSKGVSFDRAGSGRKMLADTFIFAFTTRTTPHGSELTRICHSRTTQNNATSDCARPSTGRHASRPFLPQPPPLCERETKQWHRAMPQEVTSPSLH